MSSAPPQGQPQPALPQTDSPNVPPPLSWEGDKMFNIYIYDYCFKRGFRKTARELMIEADISPDPTPPINARQGLLFEWWSVFWVLFQAKSNNNGPDDAILYTHHQASLRQNAPRIPTGPLAIGPPQQQQQPQPGQPPLQPGQQQPMGRLVNGAMGGLPRPANAAYMPNGIMPNGVGVGMPGQPPQMQPGAPMSFTMQGGHPPPQQNGVSGPAGGQQPPPGTNPGQPMQFNPMIPGQRPPMNGQPPQPGQQGQQRPGAGPGPFQSPTMAHSPQNASTPGHPGQQQQQGQHGAQPPAPMAQLSGPGPSPHLAPMRGSMPPPNGIGIPMNTGQPGPPHQQGGPPTPGYSQGPPPPGSHGRPPSRTNTPGSAMMPHASPSMVNRQPAPGNPNLANLNAMISNMPNNPQDLNNEILQIPIQNINMLKAELGIPMDREIPSLTANDKSRILMMWKSNMINAQKLGNAAAGPSHMGGQPPQGQRPLSQQQHPRQGNKRNSSSPGEEHATTPRNESSPPDRKRIRRSPAEQNATTFYPPQFQDGNQQQHQQRQQQQLPPQQGQHAPQLQGTPQQLQMNSTMMRGGMAINGANPPGPQPGSVPGSQMGGMMIAQPQMQANQIHQRELFNRQLKQGLNPFNASGHVPSPAADPGFNTGGPSGGGPGPQFNPTPLNRMGTKAPSNMMPPPSPAIHGQTKDPQGKDNSNKGPPPGGQQQQQHNPDGSPRNPVLHPGAPPPTPGPNPQNNPGAPLPQQQVQAPPPPGGPPSNPMQLMTTSSMLGMPPDLGGMFVPDFMPDMALDGFDPTLFRPGPDGDINFERDFGQWFNNPDDANGSLDMK